jgi:hypothetical protein
VRGKISQSQGAKAAGALAFPPRAKAPGPPRLKARVRDPNKRWQEHMADILDVPFDPATGSYYVLEKMFHHD